MLKSLFQFLFGSFSRKAKIDEQREQERLLIKRMIQEAQSIADGSFIVDSDFKVQKERRKKPRE